MGLRFDPIGGGQFKQALKAIIEAERIPINTLEQRKGREDAKMKLFQEFKGKFAGIDKTLAEFTNFSKFRELKVDLGDGASHISVTLDKDRAEPGTYLIQVDQLARKSSVISNGFEDPDEPLLGVGFVVVNTAKGSKEIFIDDAHASLKGVADAINKEKESPIRASVIRDLASPDEPWKLILSGKKDGFDDHVEFPEFYFLDGAQDFYIDDSNEAQNALINLDGFAIEAESNSIKDFVPGMNLHLKQARPDSPFSVTVTEDYQKISGKVKGMLDQVNGILEFINKQNKVDDKSDTRATFAGDTSLQTVEYRLRNLLHEGFPVGDPDSEDFKFVFLNEIGVEFDKVGQLQFKEDKFTKLMENDFGGLSEMITGEFGFANQLRSVIASYTRQPDGLLGVRETGMRTRIKKLDEDIANKERRLEQKSQALTEQFSRLQASLGAMQRQQQYLSATLPGAGGGGGNMVAQLLGG